MEPRDFCYWLQGFFEIEGIGLENDMEGIHPEQVKMIRDHLSLVFTNVTKNVSEKEQAGPTKIPLQYFIKNESSKETKDIEKSIPDPLESKEFEEIIKKVEENLKKCSLGSYRDRNRRYC